MSSYWVSFIASIYMTTNRQLIYIGPGDKGRTCQSLLVPEPDTVLAPLSPKGRSQIAPMGKFANFLSSDEALAALVASEFLLLW